ncbi:hypothetical protein CYL16_06110 [Mycobacterium sp. EPG1]|nr:hypothetical protein CYL16_06110 [Mycobacterium sp. EPG1]
MWPRYDAGATPRGEVTQGRRWSAGLPVLTDQRLQAHQQQPAQEDVQNRFARATDKVQGLIF